MSAVLNSSSFKKQFEQFCVKIFLFCRIILSGFLYTTWILKIVWNDFAIWVTLMSHFKADISFLLEFVWLYFNSILQQRCDLYWFFICTIYPLGQILSQNLMNLIFWEPLHCIKYQRIRVLTDPCSRIFYAVLHLLKSFL